MDEEREAQLARFRRMAGMFQQFGEQYELDWLLLVAQGYQESRLDHSARSPAGAVGVMQILPSTGLEMGFWRRDRTGRQYSCRCPLSALDD